MKETFYNAAIYCNEIYGSELIYDERGESGGNAVGFICPGCGEPIYEEDWSDEDTENWGLCPICEQPFGN